MSNCLFAWPDRVLPSSTITPTFTGGSWTLPLTNLQDAALGTVARSTNALTASTTFDIDLGATRELRVFAIPDHNMSSAATIRVIAATDASFASWVADSGPQSVWPRYYPAGSLPATHESYSGGKLTAEARSGLRSGWWYALPYAVQGRYVRVMISDASNPSGYVQINRLICSPAWQPDLNMSWGIQSVWVPTTDQIQTLGGATWFDRRTPRRSQQITLEALTTNQVMTWAWEMQRILGIDGELFFVFDPDDTDLLLKQRSFLANVRQLSAIEYPYYNACKTALELIEKL